jgi:hypothetical protein
LVRRNLFSSGLFRAYYSRMAIWSFMAIRPMSRMRKFSMHESFNPSQVCASALLDAYSRNDAPQMSEIAADARIMGMFYATSSSESERLELLGGIALEMHRSASLGKAQDLDPYVKLLLNLAYPDWAGSSFAHGN